MDRKKIDVEGLLVAVETELPHIEHFLDLRTGEVLTVVKGALPNEEKEIDLIARDNLALSRKVQQEPESYERIPTVSATETLVWMREWLDTLGECGLKERLSDGLYECAEVCFKEFRQELLRADQEMRECWFEFRGRKLEIFVDAWIQGVAEEPDGRYRGNWGTK